MKKTVVLSAILAAFAGSACAAGTGCDAVTKLNLPHTEITSAKVIAKGAYPAPAGRGGRAGGPNPLYTNLPSFCQVLATSRPTSDSEIKIEVWLPVEGWNGSLEAVGNGAFGSNIPTNNLAEGVTAGYAVVGTNTGHEGNSGEFAFGHPEKLIDWGYRAVHEMIVASKAIVAADYGNAAKYSYWNSCSTGGREGLIAAEYYPNDFDGLAVGDAANPMTRLQASTIYNNLAMNKDETTFMPKAKWDAYRQAVKAKCDAADGLKDGLINDPMSCKFDPKEMECKDGNRDDCLTTPQIAAVNKIVAGMKNPRTGEQLFPGWPVGANPAWLGNKFGDKPEQVAIDTFRALFQSPDWDYHKMDFDKDIARSDDLGNPMLNAADETRLKALFAHGGKLFMYHGWNDPSITPMQAINYYSKAIAANGGTDKTYDSIRLFMVPGMNHCGGGEGPNVFDKMDVISSWVETGKAPNQIVAAHPGPDGKPDRTRPLCPYPQVAKYKGTGSIDEAQNFTCAKP
jgi:feruloyl esterase